MTSPGPGAASGTLPGPAIAAVVGGGLLLLGPLGGLATTSFLLVQAFDAVATADPSQKAALLSSKISWAMRFTAGGLGVGVLGAAIALVSVLVFLRGRRLD